MTIQHYDPIHDGWLTRFVNHLRFKLLDLPPAYAKFIKSKLEPGGAIVYFEGALPGCAIGLGRAVFSRWAAGAGFRQRNSWKAATGINLYAHRAGLKFTDWRLKDYPLENGPESEWGSEPGLAEALE